MIVPDANLLIYASDSRSMFHERARRWWTDALNGDEAVGLSWLVLVAFVRLMSSARIMKQPVAVGDLLDEIERLLSAPHVQVLQPTARHPAARAVAAWRYEGEYAFYDAVADADDPGRVPAHARPFMRAGFLPATRRVPPERPAEPRKHASCPPGRPASVG